MERSLQETKSSDTSGGVDDKTKVQRVTGDDLICSSLEGVHGEKLWLIELKHLENHRKTLGKP